MDLLENPEEQQPLSGDCDCDADANNQNASHQNNIKYRPETEEDASLYMSSCNANIYNAFLIANYRQDIRFKRIDFISRDMTYGLGFLAYTTAVVQWIALFTMIVALMVKTGESIELDTVLTWTAWPDDGYALLIWPFFFIGLLSTYKQFSQIWVDIHILQQWNINNKQWHVVLLKYLSELILYTLGSFLFYVTLSWYSFANVDFLDVILKLLAYQFIFMTDEWAYQLIQDIVKRRIIPEQCNSFFQGKRIGAIYKYEMMVFIMIPLSMSLIIQGIYSTSYIFFGVGIISTVLWSFDSRCCRKTEVPMYL